jgi:hypothetical protein
MKTCVFLLVAVLCSGIVQAAEDEAALLIKGCEEVEAIYMRRGEKNLLAGLTTSVAEALRAGYCKGVLEQYRRSGGCPRTDWVDQAQTIGREPVSEKTSVTQLLRKTCG